MYRLICTSSACCWLTWADVDALCVETRTAAAADDVNGVIVHDGGRFLHVFEGPRTGVLAAYDRVRCDRRLQDVALRDAREAAVRRLHGWDIACQEVSTIEDARSLATRVRRMTAHIDDPAVRIHADGFLMPVAQQPARTPMVAAMLSSFRASAVQAPA